MKPILASIFMLASCATFAQTLVPFPQPGTILGNIYHGNWTSPGISNRSYEYVRDTTINSVNYSFFLQVGSSNSAFYTRYDAGKVYLSQSNINGVLGWEEFKYDFSLQVNDTFPSMRLGNLVVDSVGTATLLDGSTRKYMRLSNNTYQVEWIDAIGDINRGFQYLSDFEGGYEEFVCHRDFSGFLYYNATLGMDCDSLVGYVGGVGVEHIQTSDDGFSLYPNPAATFIDLVFEDGLLEKEIMLLNYMGQTVLQMKNRSDDRLTLDISGLASGMYFIYVLEGQKKAVKKFIKL